MAIRPSFAAAVLVAGFLSWPALAQTTPAPAAPADQPAADAAPAPDAAPAATPQKHKAQPLSGKRLACRETGKTSGLKGADRMDQFQLCVAQGRLDCTKEAIDKKIPNGAQRIAYIKQCLG
ncbi:hypothetical protein [Labrys wisconsinensis]|uniref:Nucleoid-associated protein YgaU n=1 Tax=Labrys wisconsinensis TaxID=425677 RepID=A0ABU0J215_9HYPH|nr:hypothetical protein [Labrys wisconsinensis]MDQ0468297.1 nucleoid-associated protein YgaU [Labrys wisconsinensis]